ncbi:MAG: UDP-N-acetylglucosamine 2-epimerase (non-hydrolyzing) [Chloroflexi bacterium]|nr:UDP-N-acetylglucosamine 2-epimerase (non-hydrolyzing) [Chloroflexota bacterium]
MIKVLTVFGTRPEAIKMAPVVQALARDPTAFTVRVCVTAQHRELLDQVLALFHIAPDYDLDIMRPNQSLAGTAAAVLLGLEPVLEAERPDWVLVQGDTTTVAAASLAAFYSGCRVGHVEAGLRTYDRSQPFPEEMNRRIASLLGDLHFAPTERAAANLRREGIPADRVIVTGNTVIDAIRQVADLPFDPAGTPLADLPLGRRRLILVTAHRRENFGRGMEEICSGLRTLAERHDDIHLVYPVHPNPNVREPVCRLLGGIPNITLLPPLEYQPLVWLMKQSHFVITDSGGIQEEAPGLGKPVLVLRRTTERPEGVEAGVVKLVGPDRAAIAAEAERLLRDPVYYQQMARAANPYGDGRAAERIASALRQFA